MRRLFSYHEASAALAGLLLLITCGAAAAQEFAGREKLRAHSSEFRREVIEVTSGVWVAVGFSDANSVLIEGESGSIVVDTTSDAEDAKAVKAEFAKLSTAPVRAIIYTHSHPDHTGGGGVFWFRNTGTNQAPLWLFGTQMIVMVANAFVMNNAAAGAISVRPEAAGTAAGAMGFLQQGIGALVSQFGAYLGGHSTTTLPLTAAIFALSIACASAMFFLVPRPTVVVSEELMKKAEEEESGML